MSTEFIAPFSSEQFHREGITLALAYLLGLCVRELGEKYMLKKLATEEGDASQQTIQTRLLKSFFILSAGAAHISVIQLVTRIFIPFAQARYPYAPLYVTLALKFVGCNQASLVTTERATSYRTLPKILFMLQVLLGFGMYYSEILRNEALLAITYRAA